MELWRRTGSLCCSLEIPLEHWWARIISKNNKYKQVLILQQDGAGVGHTISALPALGLCCPLPPSSEESRHLVKNIIYGVLFPGAGPSVLPEAAAFSVEGESKAGGAGKPAVPE